jgi:hypothetical protein
MSEVETPSPPSENAKHSKRRMRRARLLLLLITVLFCLTVIEIGLRIAGFSYPEFYVVDERRGYSLRPGVEGWYRKEGVAYVSINGNGLRDREHNRSSRPTLCASRCSETLMLKRFRFHLKIVFVQCSNRSCANARVTDANVEVINFGVSGYGTAQELITLRDQVWQYSPDMVLLAMTTNNDISDNVRELKRVDKIPYFTWRDDALVEDQSFLHSSAFRWRRSFVAVVWGAGSAIICAWCRGLTSPHAITKRRAR